MDFLHITIDFDQSHLFFPRIVGWVLAILGAAIALVYGKDALGSVRGGAFTLLPRGFDRIRFFGSVVLVVLYLLAMDALSDLWPNRGYAFVIASVGFMLALSRLYVRDFDRVKAAVMVATAFAVPALTWWIFAGFFQLTLP